MPCCAVPCCAVQEAMEKGELADPLPSWVLEQYQLMPWLPALHGMHSPGDEEQLAAARGRLAFQELLALQLKLLVQRNMAWCVGAVCCVGGGWVAEAAAGRDASHYSLTFMMNLSPLLPVHLQGGGRGRRGADRQQPASGAGAAVAAV